MDFLLKLVIGMTVLATIAAVNEGDGDLVKMFAKERKEMREEQKEMRAVFQQEIDELHNRNNKQSQELQKLHRRLHRADLKNKEAHRQRDEKQSQELKAIRQERHSSELEDVVESVVKRSIRHSGKNNTNNSLEIELKKLIDHQIDQYLIKQRICVGGKFGYGTGYHTQTVNFGYEFPRTPTVSASLAFVYKNAGAGIYMKLQILSVTRSSAIIKSAALWGSAAALDVSWLACL